MTAATPKGLHAKLAEVMAEADRIPKKGRAPAAMGGFEFVQVGDAADAIRKALGSRGVSMLPSGVDVVGEAEHATSSGKTMTTLTIRTTWTLVDGETGQSATIQSLGAGADMGDKAAPKAQSNAMKYALLMGFLLSTGDDPEQTDTSDRQARGAAPAAPAKAPEPVYVSQGHLAYTGVVKKGDGQFNDVEYHQDPDGHRIGFRLEIAGGSAIHEVLVTGALGEALRAAVTPAELLGATVSVEGEAFRIDQQGRRPRARLVVSSITSEAFKVPAPEAASIPLFEPADKGELESLVW